MSHDIQYIVMLICTLPKQIDSLKRNKSSLPPHINIAYLKSSIDENEVEKKLSNISAFDVKLDEVMCDPSKLSIAVSRVTNINKICDKLKDSIERKPQNYYHLSLINSKTKWTTYECENMCKKINESIKLPVDIMVTDIWLMKKDTNKKNVWIMAKKIKLKPV